MLWLWVVGCTSEPAVTVAAASSLREVLPPLVERFTEDTGVAVRVTYGGSGGLAAQLRAGAPIDTVLFAGQGPLDDLVADGLVLGTPDVVATNTLVLVGRDNSVQVGFSDLHTLSRVAIADPRTAPIGAYARDLLTPYGHWGELAGKAVAVSDVAAGLALVRRGEVQAAVVYGTDARLAPELTVWQEVQQVAGAAPAVVASDVQPGRSAFVQSLSTEAARELWQAHGFLVPQQ